MKKFLKWFGMVIGGLAILAFFAFLYFIPPFTIAPPEAFSDPVSKAPPSLARIQDPALRAIAERGKYIVTYSGCSDCHTPQGDKGPIWDEYLAGGNKLISSTAGTVMSRNLTPDPQTGTGRRTIADLQRTLRSGVLSDGRQTNHRAMPWSAFSNWTEEDRYAVIIYLRNLKPVKHGIPDPSPEVIHADPAEKEFMVVGDYATH